MFRLMSLAGVVGMAWLFTGMPQAQTASTAANLCRSSEIVSSPNRPNLASSADVTECGLLELEQGWTAVHERNGDHEDFLNTTLRYGLGHNLDVRWSADLMARDSESADHESGVGDNGAAVRYRFWKQSRGMPAMAVQYGAKLPSADGELGSGYTDHNLGFLASKDFGPVHLDYNLVHAWIGGSAGYGPYTYAVAALSGTLRGRLGGVLEFSGDLQPAGCPATTLALTYKINRRLTLDGGVTLALSTGEARNRVLLGFTYAIWKYARAPRAAETTSSGS